MIRNYKQQTPDAPDIDDLIFGEDSGNEESDK